MEKLKIHNWVIVFGVAVCLSGCAKIQHLDQLLTLKAMGEEGERLDKYVKVQDEKFKILVSDFENNRLAKGLPKKSVIKKYGDPIYEKPEVYQGREGNALLYRNAINKHFDSAKMYLYFDTDGKLWDWQYFAAPLPDEPDDLE